MKSTLFALAAAAAMAFHAPLAAEQKAKTKVTDDTLAEVDPVTISQVDADKLKRIIAHPDRRWIKKPCDLGLPVMTELLRRQPEEAGFQRGRLYAESFCASEKKDWAKAQAALDRLENEFALKNLDQLSLHNAIMLDQGDAALTRLSRLVRRDGGAGLVSLPSWTIDLLEILLRKQGREKELGTLLVEMIRSNAWIRLDPDFQRKVALGAIVPAIENDLTYLVPQMLNRIGEPDSYDALLAERRYEIIWPIVERHVGPGLSLVTARNLTEAQERFAAEPDDRDRVGTLANALNYAGRYEETADLAAKLVKRIDGGRVIELGDAWALNASVDALDALGRKADGDAMFDRLAQIDADAHPWIVNFVINRAYRLNLQGRWAESLPAADLAGKVADKYGSTYARMLVAMVRTCALHNLARGDEAAAPLAYLNEHRADAVSVAAQGMICAGQTDAAAKFLTDALGSDATRSAAIAALQASWVDPSSTDSGPASPRALFVGHPELQAAFYAVARDVPKEFMRR